METTPTGTIIAQSNPDINEIVRMYAKEKGLSETAAWAAIRGTFVPKSEVLNIIESQNRSSQGQSGYQPSRLTELFAQKSDASVEKLRLELEVKKLELLEKTEAKKAEMSERAEAREQRKMDITESQLVQEKEVQMRRLELEEKRQQSKDDFNQMMLLIQSGKKPDEALEMVKHQEKFYERILDERTRHTDEVGDLKDDAEKKLKEIKAEMDSKFDKVIKEYQSKPASDDFINKMKEYKKMQNEFLDMTFDTLEARGFDKKQLEQMRTATNIKVTEQQESGIGKLYDVGKLIWKNYVEPAADKAQKELSAPPPPELSPEVQLRIREETQAKADQIQEQNRILQEQLDTEKKKIQRMQDDRIKLELTANGLGIPFDNTTSDQDLFNLIEYHEANNERRDSARREAFQREERARGAVIPQENESPIEETVVPEPEGMNEDPTITELQLEEQGVLEINIQEELAKPYETSPETLNFINEVEVGIKNAEDELENELASVEPTVPVPVQQNDKPEKKAGKKKDKKEKRIYEVSDGTRVIETESISHKSAAMTVTNDFGGTEEAPVMVKVTDDSGDERKYNTFSVEREGSKGKKWMAPRARMVK